MNDLDNAHYYAQRAKIERELADQSGNDLVANIHRELANRYLQQSRQSNDVPLTMLRP